MRYFVVFLAIALLFSAESAVSQSSRNWQYYLKGGYTYATLLSNSDADIGFAGGYAAGLGLKIPLRAGYSFQSELALIKYSSLIGANRTERKLSFTYVSVPLLLNYKINDLVELVGGIEPAFLVKAKSINTEDAADVSNYGKNDFSEIQVWPTAGLEVNMSPISIGLRYMVNPFSTFNNDQLKTSFPDARIHGGQLYAALVF
jgi:hypothetical protein